MLTWRAAFRASHEGYSLSLTIKSERTSIVIKTAVARRYAQALFELLDHPPSNQPVSALTGLGQAIKDSVALRHVVASPAFGAEDKIAVLAELGSRLGCPPVGKTFLGQLVKKNRVGFLPEIAEAFAKLADASKGTQQVTVFSATAIPPGEQDQISTRLRDNAQAPSRSHLSYGCPPSRRPADPSRQHGGR